MSIVLDGTSGLTTNSGTLISASTIGVGGATPSTSGAGISFPATQSASTNANTLDDYEEGTFDATVTMSTSGTCTLNTSFDKMKYTKIGRVVSIQGQIYVNSVSSPVGAMRISLPFTNAASDEQSSISGCVPRIEDVTKPATGLYPYVYTNGPNAFMEMVWSVDNGANLNHVPAAGDFFLISFSYCV